MAKYKFRNIGTFGTKNWREECGIATFGEDQIQDLSESKRGEFIAFYVTAITDGKRALEYPVDTILQKRDIDSLIITGNRVETKTIESRVPGLEEVFVYQYEGGLYPEFDKNGKIIANEDGKGCSYFIDRFAKDPNIWQYVIIHTPLYANEANPRYIRNIKHFGKKADGLIVMTKEAKDIFSKAPFNIDPIKIHYIPHGIRINPETREQARKRIGIPLDLFLNSEPGIRSLNKGNFEFILGNTKFMEQCLSKSQRKRYHALLIGGLHPEFIKQEGGKYAKLYNKIIEDITKNARIGKRKLKFQKTKSLEDVDWYNADISLVDGFQELPNLLGVYASSNVVTTLYPELKQGVSGTGSDTKGTETPLISTKTRWACENINPHSKTPKKGMVISGMGILVDKDVRIKQPLDEEGNYQLDYEAVNNLVPALSYLVFNKDSDGNYSVINMGHRNYEDGRSKIWEEFSKSFLNVVENTKKRLVEKSTTKGFKKVKDTPSIDESIKNSYKTD